MTLSAEHQSVMAEEVGKYLNPREGGCIVDCTVGLGGHALAVGKLLGPRGRLIGMDRDSASLELARGKLSSLPGNFELRHSDFRNLDKVLEELKISQVDGILFDLGLSSFQLNDPQRGFSFNSEGPLDMRMDQESFINAYDLINSLSEKELMLIFRNFGEERFSSRIARRLVYQRRLHPIETTRQLTEEVLKALPSFYRHQRIHPATRIFQAIRIAVNRELEALEMALSKCPQFLKPGGRIVVLAFHSLEDRIVKTFFKSFAEHRQLKILTKKPLRPTEEEINQNSRCRSARLRAAEKLA